MSIVSKCIADRKSFLGAQADWPGIDRTIFMGCRPFVALEGDLVGRTPGYFGCRTVGREGSWGWYLCIEEHLLRVAKR